MIWFLVLIVVIAVLFGLMRLGEKEMKKKEEEKPEENKRPTVFKNKGNSYSGEPSDENSLWTGSKSITMEYMNAGNFNVIDIEITRIWEDDRGDTYFKGYGQAFNAIGVMKLKNASGRKFESFYDYMEKDLKI